jgi:branched-chain amino acid transport system ATP-binding protein/neutral amino acid transport system ATP-binding protein
MSVESGRPAPNLVTESVASGYGAGLIVRGVSIQAGPGEVVTIIGPNGSGKSTLLKTIAGLVPTAEGRVLYGGADVSRRAAEHRARDGIAYVPQEREVFASLTVRENLTMGGYHLSRKQLRAALERVYSLYDILPPLEKTYAGRLSGGERKMLAMARVMMASPSVVLLDEPTSNLAPIPSARLLEHDVPALARAGVSVLLVEQRAVQAIAASNWVYVLVAGEVAAAGEPSEIGGRGDIGRMFLGASGRTDGASGETDQP